MSKHSLSLLGKLCTKVPSQCEADSYQKWLLYEDILSFLIKEKLNDEIIIYASTSQPSSILLNSFFVPKLEVESINAALIQEIIKHSFAPPSSAWDFSYTIPSTKNADIKDYNFQLEDSSFVNRDNSNSISKYEHILFLRLFEGKMNQKHYVEIAQKVLHLQDLHYVAERKAFCKFDYSGDIMDYITVHYNNEETVCAVTARKEVVVQFMAVTDMVLIRMFDITRTPEDFHGYQTEQKKPLLVRNTLEKVFCDGGYTSTASYLRGFQVIDCKDSRGKVLKSIVSYNKNEPTNYSTFFACDWRNNKIDEFSCDPQKLSNYFIESELPHELSPAFFKKDVLLKYQNDPDKYTIDRRRIYCRGGWYLKSYDINEEGQVHAYLIDLAQLPYQEQLYWKSYNEKPKGTISRRAYVNDFEGKVFNDRSPLDQLKLQLKNIHNRQLSWWKSRDISLINKTHYLATHAQKEWEDAITHLYKLLVDGVNHKYIVKLSEEVGIAIDSKESSLKILSKYLVYKGYEQQLMNPFFKLTKLRSNISAHVQSKGKSLVEEALSDHSGSLAIHFSNLIQSFNQAIEELDKILK